MVKNSFCTLFFVLLTSCSSKSFDDVKQLTDYLNDEENGYLYSKNVNGVEYKLLYKPTDLLVQQELEKKHSAKQVDGLRKKYSKYLYFNLSMSKNNQELLNGVARNKAKFGQMVNDLAFGMEEKVHVFTPINDTLAMADFIYPRMFGMSQSTSIMIVYPREEKYLNQEYLNFVVEDLGLDTGDVKFKINTKALKNEPQLKF